MNRKRHFWNVVIVAPGEQTALRETVEYSSYWDVAKEETRQAVAISCAAERTVATSKKWIPASCDYRDSVDFETEFATMTQQMELES